LLTDGRMSGASGKVLAAIQVTPEAADDGVIARIRDGDTVSIDAEQGKLTVAGADDDPGTREVDPVNLSDNHAGLGRELFASFRRQVSGAEQGASALGGSD
jgi:phosphogluconate dehydratase